MMNGYMILAAVMLVVCVLTCMLLSHHIQKKMEATYQNLLQRLDRAIGGEIQDTAYDESMDAAVTERLNRVVQISRMNQEKAEKENFHFNFHNQFPALFVFRSGLFHGSAAQPGSATPRLPCSPSRQSLAKCSYYTIPTNLMLRLWLAFAKWSGIYSH